MSKGSVRVNSNPDDGRIEDLASRKTLTQEEVVTNVRKLVRRLHGLNEYDSGAGKKIQKSIALYYWDHEPIRMVVGDVMADEHYAEATMKMLRKLQADGIYKNDSVWLPTYYAYETMWNFTDASTTLSTKLAEADVVTMLTLNLTHQPVAGNVHNKMATSKNVLYLRKSSLGILHNMARIPEIKHYLKENNCAEVLKSFFSAEDEMMKMLAMISTACIIDETENEALIDETGVIRCILQWIEKALVDHERRYNGFTPKELVQGLDKLAVNDSNKVKIVSDWSVGLFNRMLQSAKRDEQIAAAAILWTLSFDKSVKKIIIENQELIATLEKLKETKAADPDLIKNIYGIFWIIHEDEKSQKSKKENVSSDTQVFLSYCWSNKPEVLTIKEHLVKHGYKVWIDVNDMHGNMLDAMADGIEKSAIFLLAMSERYKQSPMCRTEAEYAHLLRKTCVPVKVQPRYKPDGWLGLILGHKLYIDFSRKDSLEEAIQALLEELRILETTGAEKKQVVKDTGHSEKRTGQLSVSNRPAYRTVSTLTNDDVSQWLISNDLGHVVPAFNTMDGRMLQQLVQLRTEAPEFFYRQLETSFRLNVFDILRFMEASSKLSAE